MLKNIQSKVESTEYKNYQVYFAIICSVLSIGLYLDVDLIISIWSFFEQKTISNISIGTILTSSLNGIIVGLIGFYLYDDGERYHKSIGETFDSKETAFAVKILLLTIISLVLYEIIPVIIERYTTYPAVQTLGAVILLGFILLHVEVENWKLDNEIPVIMGSLLLLGTPFII